MRRITYSATVLVLGLVSLFFWLVPHERRSDLVTSAGLLITAVCAGLLSLLSYRALRTWRGLGALVALHIASQAWLQWQWGLWDSPVVLVRNLNVVMGLVAWATFVAITISLLLLLYFQDASVIALATAWLGWPILLIGTAYRYHTLAALNDVPFREQMVLVVPVCLLTFLIFAGGLAFLAHLVALAVKEIAGREIAKEA